ncbi:GntR family transcriptional regulator [Isoptericola sp. CG 20/1183]|uniref:GntR family transcriptional regulator n=1 Tax=Isoptericola halotolerans TaxID=300560 RepID=A0ABX5EHE9_9MICO|nr:MULTISPECIES: GntR family transcriptional regulator [Isoptericola]MCK0115948.1 GntR family transcriptional regulator [Isoptericola sp. S6320L]PRZ08864.1 GntR family transcriptional regulator [Isoptericola halotolerans]PRZ10689.1 GntR family transcriptional regulator [Isoptericola sp. CG 20/1183]
MTTQIHEPKYEALRARLEADIRTGLRPHDPLPSERKLMATYEVSRMTVRQALRLLADDGLVYRVQGSGTFVADPTMITKSLTLTSFTEDITARGMLPGSRSQEVERIEAEAEVAQDLGLSPGAPVVHVQRVRTADGSPMCIEDVWVPADLLPPDFGTQSVASLYATFESLGQVPDVAEQTIRATVVDSAQAALLDVAPHSPAFVVSRVTYTADARPIERGRSVYRADRYDFRVSVQRRRHP